MSAAPTSAQAKAKKVFSRWPRSRTGAGAATASRPMRQRRLCCRAAVAPPPTLTTTAFGRSPAPRGPRATAAANADGLQPQSCATRPSRRRRRHRVALAPPPPPTTTAFGRSPAPHGQIRPREHRIRPPWCRIPGVSRRRALPGPPALHTPPGSPRSAHLPHAGGDASPRYGPTAAIPAPRPVVRRRTPAAAR
ncbi:uncharacterized protein [Oryza sativa Japonica Group]|uniref:Os03g0631566 protein n=1 Tax=Oryza sativa subsp. japonica TaxID=39947 RepID=A0A0P0W0E5_ORYSJ|nr:Os03g0631566 [Oryza sativa Japonica Group]